MTNLNKKKKLHFIYKTVNLLTGEYYIGMHSTSNVKDGYRGSGTRLRYSIRKYGIENFECKILEWYSDRESLVAREKEIVTEDTIKDPMCLNLKPGGNGGFTNLEHAKKFHAAGGRAVCKMFTERRCERLRTDSSYREEYRRRMKRVNMVNGHGKFYGKKHTEETKRKIGESNSVLSKGSRNSQYGTYWVTNGIESKKVKKGEGIPKGWRLGRVCKRLID